MAASRPSTPAPPKRWRVSRRCSPARRSPRSSPRCQSARPSPRPITARWPSTSCATPARRSRWSWPRIATSRATPPTRSSSTYDPLPVVVDPELAMTGKPVVIHEAFANNLAVALVPSGTGVTPDGKVDDSAVDRAFAQAEVVISQRMVNQRLVPNAMEPRGVRGPLRARQEHDDDLVVDAEPAHPAHDDRGDDRHGPGPGARHRPGSGRRLRRQDQHLPRGVRRGRRLEAARAAGEVDRGPLRGVRGHDARARHHRLRGHRGEARRARARAEDAADRRHRRLQHAADGGHSHADDADGQRDLRHPGHPHDADGGLHQQDADRRLSRRRPARGHLLRRACDGHAGGRAEDGSGRGAAEELHRQGQVPVPDADGRGVRLGRLREGARPGAAEGGLERPEGGARRRAGRGPAGRPRPGDVRRGLRPRALVVAADRRVGARAGDHRARRAHQRHHGRVAARPRQRDDLRADARGSVLACRSSTSPSCTATPAW